ncbi:unnamed protein product, partial [Gulo gulo]
SPKTELRCSSPGVQTIRPIVTGPDSEEERNLSVDSSHICFLWYFKVMLLLYGYMIQKMQTLKSCYGLPRSRH